ncbi:MAG TPA: hypothetical protein VL243_16295 [Vicinamibacterales bacterium]|nr:hypothetical protein [Vicinamibacterales bacterium]
MRTPTRSVMLLGTLLMSGCAYMPPVQLDATPADLELLTGEWRGEYDSATLGRHGTIEFKLVAGRDQATGDVVMTPQGSDRPYQRGTLEHPPRGADGWPEAQILSIRFVRASGGAISGMLDPYWDPDRNCQARTVFSGTLVEWSIDGTFRTTFDCGSGEATGHWRASRKPAAKDGRYGG